MAKRKQRKKKKGRAGFDEATYQKIEGWLLHSSHCMQDGEYDEVIASCEKVLKHRKATKKQRSEAYTGLAGVHSVREDFIPCFDMLTRAIDLAPTPQWDFYYNRAMIGRYVSRLGRSLRDMEKAAELCTDPIWVANIAERDMPTVIQLLEMKRASYPDPITIDELIEHEETFQSGFKAMRSGDLEQAEIAFSKVLERPVNIPQPHFNLGSVYAMRGEWDKAEEMWQTALEIEPNYEMARVNLSSMDQLRSGKTNFADGIWGNKPYKGKIKGERTFSFIEK